MTESKWVPDWARRRATEGAAVMAALLTWWREYWSACELLTREDAFRTINEDIAAHMRSAGLRSRVWLEFDPVRAHCELWHGERDRLQDVLRNLPAMEYETAQGPVKVQFGRLRVSTADEDRAEERYRYYPYPRLLMDTPEEELP